MGPKIGFCLKLGPVCVYPCDTTVGKLFELLYGLILIEASLPAVIRQNHGTSGGIIQNNWLSVFGKFSDD